MIKSIFFARFHQEQGPKVLHQVPEGSIIPCPPSPTAQTPFFNFQSISEYIIPRREFCDRLLAVCIDRCRVIGYPVCITDDARYDRNDFIFNFCLVLDEDTPWNGYASIVKKLAKLFRNLEEQDGFLSKEEAKQDFVVAGDEGYGGGTKVYALCEMVMEDLNNYRECMIPIDDSNTLNLKLFPTRPPPPPIYNWHVPLSLVRFSSLQTSAWDLTVQRIIPYVDGVNSVSVIAKLADTDLTLTRRAIAHLVYYGCVLLLDMFSFGATYAPTADIGNFVTDETMQDECRRYVASPFSLFGKDTTQLKSLMSTLSSRSKTSTVAMQPVDPPSRSQIIDLYTSLRQGQTMRDWCISRQTQLTNIDVRRLITFGVINGFLYRVHKYPIALRPADLDIDGEDPIEVQRKREKAWRKAAMSSGWRTPKEEAERQSYYDQVIEDSKDEESKEQSAKVLDLQLARYVDGMHCLDEICTELGTPEREAVRRLKTLGDVVLVQR